jgi:prophage DNA circulation protein
MSGLLSAVMSNLDGVLQTAAFDGVTFDMVDVREVAGRRLVKFLFPHSDLAAFRDLGAEQGDITITGIIGGDDYVIRAERMRMAFLTEGPAVLLHPWLGEMIVVLMPRPEIQFHLAEIGVARLQFVVQRYDPPTAGPTDTLGALLTSADALIDSGTLMIEQVLAPVALPLALFASLTGFFSEASAVWNGLIGSGTGLTALSAQLSAAAAGASPVAIGDGFAAVAQPSLTALSTGVQAPTNNIDTTFADTVAALLFATPAAIAAASQQTATPAIGSAAGAVINTAPVLDPTETVNLLLAAATAIAALGDAPAASVSGSGLAPLAIATAAAILAQAVSVGVSLPFTSQQDAITWRGTLDGALSALAGQVVTIGVAQPIAANAVFNAIAGLRAAVAADFNSLIGRLPAVITITTNRTMSAWLIALYLAGDTPSNMLAALQDVVQRNGVVNPGVVPAGALEVLQQS